MFNFLKSKKKEDSNKTNNQQIKTSYEIDEEELFREDPNEKAKIEAWWLQKGIEDAVEEDYEIETDHKSDENDELMEDSDDLIYSLREEDDDDDDIDLVIKEALDALGDSTSEELLEIGKEILLNIKGHISIEKERATENINKVGSH